MRQFFLPSYQPTLNLAESDSTAPALLLLHGFSNRWQVFQAILPHLLLRWRVLTLDFRGHGASGRAPGAYTAAGFYQDAEAVLLHYAASAPIVLFGHSMGGSMALHLAQNYPHLVRAVATGDASLHLQTHINVMNNRRNTKLFGLRRKLAGRPAEELIRRGLPPAQAEEMSLLDPAVMDFHAEGRVEGFFAGVDDVDFRAIRCPVWLSQADPQKGGLLQDEEIPPVLEANPHFGFARFPLGHDLEIESGIASPFWQAALQWFDRL